VREASAYYQAAIDKAWEAIRHKLEISRRQLGAGELVLERVTIDQDSYISEIEELPPEPKAPDPDELEVRVAVNVAYRVVR
jgi:hypothetical protein